MRPPAAPRAIMKLCCLFVVLLALGQAWAAPMQVLNHDWLHFRSGSKPEWDEFANQTPAGRGLLLAFAAHTNEQQATLFIQQDNVKLDWPVEVNGKKVGTLFLMESPLVHAIALPAGTLHEGSNTLSVVPPKENDDIKIGQIRLAAVPMKTALSEAALHVEVKDQENGGGLPCRITIVDGDGNLAPLMAKEGQKLAARPGVVYTGNGEATVALLSGQYVIYATRGFEYGLATAKVTVQAGQTQDVSLRLRREVPTPGWVCSDTHIHTGTYARHGDATVEERALTLAGEGIELPISTEHDCLVDLSDAAVRAGVRQWLTPVIGAEITTAKGHFNIFPVNADAPVPDRKITDWPKLMEVLRATPDVQVVIMNHPRNIHNDFQPFAATNFNAVTGENLRGFEFTVDAIEVANSSALQSDWRISFRDWFALLNYGYRFTAVGSSDGHDVSRYIIGQGRTYIACKDTDPAQIDVNEACRNLKQGRAIVSLGLLANLAIDDRFTVGDLATGLGDRIKVRATVLGPSWVHADHVELYANGQRIEDERLTASGKGQGSGPVHLEFSWDLPRPRHDVYLVALATGPGVREPYWPIARPYQPTSPTWDPRVVSVTNPIWVDGDGDGKFTSARAYAKKVVAVSSGDSQALLRGLAQYDEAVAAQAASLCQGASLDVSTESFRTALQHAAEPVRLGFEAYLHTLPAK
jgi:hypothetical protein